MKDGHYDKAFSFLRTLCPLIFRKPRLKILAFSGLFITLVFAQAQAQVTAVNNFWTGASSSNWFDPDNWLNTQVPTSGTNITYINTTTPNAAVIDGGNATSRIIRIGDGQSASSNGALTIENGGTLDVLANSGGGYVAVGYGFPNPSIASLTVTGTGSRLSAATYIYVALFDNDQGTVTISQGGQVTAGILDVAGGADSNGSVTLTDAGSSLEVGNSFSIGDAGEGTLTISNGSVMSSGTAAPSLIGGVVTTTDSIGTGTGAIGNVTVTGAGSTLASSNPLVVGGVNPALIAFYQQQYGVDASGFFAGQGTLTIADGGTVESGIGPHTDPGFVNSSYIGGTPGSIGSVTVTDSGSSWILGGNLFVGGDGQGTLTIANGALVSATAVTLAENAGSAGTLNIGAAAGGAPAAPGTLNASTLTFGAGTGTLVFNHSDDSGDYEFSASITGTGTVNVYNGETTMTGASTYAGTTTVLGGTLAAGATNVFSANSNYSIESGGTLALRGLDQTVASLDNAGLVRIGSAPGTVLTTGNYAGQGGTIAMSTYLGRDNSPSDLLEIDGGTGSGTSLLSITNIDGPGAWTTANGIEVVDAANGATTTADAFALAGEARAGPFDYRLFRGGLDDASPDNWYLRSDMIIPEPGLPSEPGPEVVPPFPLDPPSVSLAPGIYPIIGPELATDSVVQPLARQMGLAMLDTLHQRISDTLTSIDADDGGGGWGQSVWGRVLGVQIDNRYKSFTNPSATGRLIGMQVGVDVWRGSLIPGQRDAAGVYFAYGNAVADVDGLVTNADATGYVNTRTGSANLQGYSLGGYWTHYGPTDWYLDAILQGTHYAGDAQTQYARLPTRGNGFVASLEGGYPIPLPLGPNFRLEPQAQIIWQSIGFGAANDGLGPVALGSTRGLTGRIGLRTQWSVLTEDGQLWQPYGRVNLWQNWDGNSSTTFNGEYPVPLRSSATMLELAAGVTGKLNRNLSIYGQAGYVFAIAGTFGRRQGVLGDVGLRYIFGSAPPPPPPVAFPAPAPRGL
jgi:outer membrane autotransporter protein